MSTPQIFFSELPSNIPNLFHFMEKKKHLLKQALKREVDLIEEECFEEDNMEEWEQEFYDNIKKERVIIYG